MMNLYGGAGMGAAGTGMGASGMDSMGGAMSPQIMQMLQALQGGAAGGAAPAPGPLQAQPAGTPMSNFIGQAGGQMHAGGMGMPMGAPPPIPGIDQQNAQQPQMGVSPQMLQQMQMLQQLKNGQTGVPSQVGSATPNLVWNPNNPVGTETLGGATANNGWLQNLMAMMHGGGAG